MSDVTYMERRKLEKLFEMEGGFVLDFVDRTFREFVSDSVQKDIDDQKFHYASGSKANRLRAFIKTESNFVVGKLLLDLINYAEATATRTIDPKLVGACRETAHRLMSSGEHVDLSEVSDELDEQGFEQLIRALRTSVEKGEPETGLDRLHTFATRLLRKLLEKRGKVAERDKPLQSLMGEYVKAVKAEELIETEMTERILKVNISILDAFNSVRNDHSLAHDNPVLNSDEGYFIFNSVSSLIRFILAVERRATSSESEAHDADADDLPF